MRQDELGNLDSLQDLDNNKDRLVGLPEKLHDGDRGADVVEILRSRIVLCSIALRDQPDDLALRQ